MAQVISRHDKQTMSIVTFVYSFERRQCAILLALCCMTEYDGAIILFVLPDCELALEY